MSFKHKTPIQIRFKDLDKMGHVNNANHSTYLELARMNYFNDVVGAKIDWTKQGVILARVEINYKQPVFLEDKVFVLTQCTRFGSKSFDLTHQIIKEETSENGKEIKQIELANGISVVVCFDYENNTTIAVPKDWVEKVKAFEDKNS